MKILRVTQEVYPETIGGLPYHVHALSRDQAKNGHDVTLLSLSDDVNSPTTEQQDGYTLIRHQPSLDIFGNQLSTDVIRHLRSGDEYDIVHAHSHLYLLSSISAAFRYHLETPLAVTCHGLNTQTLPQWFSHLYLRTVGRFTYNAADINFCYTDIEKRRLRDLGVDSDIRVVSNGIDSKQFTPDGEVYGPLAETNVLNVLFVGRLVPGKRPDQVVKSFSRLSNSHPDSRLFLVGDGPLREDLEQQAKRLGVADRVEFLGYVPYESMAAVYRGGDVFTLPSQAEGFPRTVMEALACETPVVASPLEQIKPLVKRSGRLVDGVEEMASAFDELLSDDSVRAELGSKGRELVRHRYGWSSTVDRVTAAMEATID